MPAVHCFSSRLLLRLRGLLITPPPGATTFARRGFHQGTERDRRRLETVGLAFLSGLRTATSGTDVERLGHVLGAGVPRAHQGFAYEGAAMGLAMLDAVGPRRRDRVARLLGSSGTAHRYMVHVGAGWALARLPPPLWRHVVPDDPLLRWLALDGYGFHEAYFRTGTRADGRWAARLPAWPGPQSAVAHVVDQGIGRAMWFVECADPGRLAGRIRRYAPDRHPDLWAGAGLAAVYSEAGTPQALRQLTEYAGRHLPELRQGAAFAAEARLGAGLATDWTEQAVRLVCGVGAAEAAEVTHTARQELPPDGSRPAYQEWRGRIQRHFSD
ncbi:DUF1702 family protein [Streptomyces sp. NPDC032161]|uniref:DUF1702 family protein n=1 Tax=unclassified Streptomyces TaxID=2593676 RepID=UPI0033C24E08